MLLIFTLLASCSGNEIQKDTAWVSNHLYDVQITPADLLNSYSTDIPEFFNPNFKILKNEHYTFKISFKPKVIKLKSDQPLWYGISNYLNKSWAWKYGSSDIINVESYNLSTKSSIFISIWSSTDTSINIAATCITPPNFIYATVTPINGYPIHVGDPVLFQWYGSDLYNGKDCYIFYFFRGPRGLDYKYTNFSKQFNVAFYDVGKRSNFYNLDSYINDSVYHASNPFYGFKYCKQIIAQENFSTPIFSNTSSYDYFRNINTEYLSTMIYGIGINSDPNGGIFHGETGAICNSIMTFDTPGFYELINCFEGENKPHNAFFFLSDNSTVLLCPTMNPLGFQVVQ